MSTPESDASASQPTRDSTTSTPSTQSDQQLVRMLQQFMAEQRAINEDMQAKQQQLLSYIEDGGMQHTLATTRVAEDQAEEDEKQRLTARHSRTSVYLNNSNNSYSAVMGGDTIRASPLAPPAVRMRTEQEQQRRASQGVLFTPGPAGPTGTTTTANSDAPPVDKSRKSKYWEANQALSRMDKFYGDKKHDKDIDVYSFVRSVDFQLNRWMGSEKFGRLELVISCTSGPAQMWLLHKQEDLNILVARQQLKPEMAEWDVVKEEFIERMGGGQVQRLYQSRLDELKMGRTGSDDVTKFMTTFREYAMRAYPLDKHPDTRARSLMLGKTFQERLRASDFSVWREAMRTVPSPETLEEWELALSSAWAIEQTVREQQKKRFGESSAGRHPGNNTGRPSSHSVHRMQVEGEAGRESQDNDEPGEGLNALTTKRVNGKSEGHKRVNNKHINGKIAAQLIRARRCLLCYKPGHMARECPAPANRSPKDDELNETAGQQ